MNQKIIRDFSRRKLKEILFENESDHFDSIILNNFQMIDDAILSMSLFQIHIRLAKEEKQTFDFVFII